MTSDWPIQQLARLSGTTSRTLRHYGDIGLLEPSRIGSNGYRYYDQAGLVRLQRILLLRELGVGLQAIAHIVHDGDSADALVGHLQALREERKRLDRQIRAVESTIEKMKGGEQLMAEESLDGFDHTAYREEVESRWGHEAYASGDAWWRSMSESDKKQWAARQAHLGADWAAAAASGVAPDSAEAQALAQRQFDWLSQVPGIPPLNRQYFVGLGELYVADDRYAANYGGIVGATFVRDAMSIFAQRLP